jgi:hypothetical protein
LIKCVELAKSIRVLDGEAVKERKLCDEGIHAGPFYSVLEERYMQSDVIVKRCSLCKGKA